MVCFATTFPNFYWWVCLDNKKFYDSIFSSGVSLITSETLIKSLVNDFDIKIQIYQKIFFEICSKIINYTEKNDTVV